MHAELFSRRVRAVSVDWQALCPPMVLSQDEIKLFMDAIKRHYAFEFQIGTQTSAAHQ
jgi:hypothetical protein